jgi:hypothetical protein
MVSNNAKSVYSPKTFIIVFTVVMFLLTAGLTAFAITHPEYKILVIGSSGQIKSMEYKINTIEVELKDGTIEVFVRQSKKED